MRELAKYLQHQSQKSVGTGDKLWLDSSSSSSSCSADLAPIFLPRGRDMSGDAGVRECLVEDSVWAMLA